MRKIQLLDSVEEQISRDLHQSNYNTAEYMFRVLENRYWNKSTITLETIEDLEKIPDVTTIQPRTVIDLFQTGKSLTDLTELRNKEAIKML